MKPVDSKPSHILPPGTELPHNYIINKILGEGGFGITYSGTLRLTGEKVAIKEYFPNGIAHRESDSNHSYQIVPLFGSEDAFEKGRQHFLSEASILKEFQNLNSIVSVKDVIETNGTVYLVMEYIDGITLKQYVKENGALSFKELLPLMKPVIHALIQVHKQGLIHRDISPENLMIGIDNQLHLIDFGAASIENGHESKTMTVILKSGYAPPEQYLSDGKQGAWTDIYALCATMYMTLTGFAPPESIRRIQQDELPSLASYADITSWQAAAIEKGMNLNAADRFQNMESLYQALIIPPLEMDSRRRSYQDSSIEDNKTIMKRNGTTKKHRRTFYMLILAGLIFAAIFPGVLLFTSNQKTNTHGDFLCIMVSDFTRGSFDNLLQSISEDMASSANNTTESTIKDTVNGITESTGKDTDKDTTNDTSQENSPGGETEHTDKKSGSSGTESATSNKSTTEKTNFDVTPIKEDDEYDTFTID